MFDHALIKVSDFEKSKALYQPVMKALGFQVYMDGEGYIGFGTKDKLELMLKSGSGNEVTRHVHLAFTARERKDVDKFHELAVAAGATVEGEPGLRHKYHPNYYAAFVLDPDGNNIEAVCHKRA